MKINELKELLNEFGDNVRFEHDLKKKNWFNIGGKSKIFYKADNLKELASFLKKLNNKEKIFILGAGSNTLINDELFDGAVIKLGKNFNNISLLGEDIIIAGSAVLDKTLSDFAMDKSLGGLGFLMRDLFFLYKPFIEVCPCVRLRPRPGRSLLSEIKLACLEGFQCNR